ncbi:MAG: methyltransferase [Aestuariivirga sp.]|uniref:class I SAM-dependent methyltransferase n=1 Tax=Aestuariivirga sp. TaxID=2650926 RepID=UPI0025BAB5AE|nr:methyltransferase [Aestuariivirga sp.]MCA3561148.1 methyltransferase [Aestuariivirga sp.]
MTPPLVPEVRLQLAHEAVPLWQKTEEELGEMGLAPPFWAFAWAGGQALARHVLDNPQLVAGQRVIDLASGSGLVAIAAMKAGATRVLAADIDAFSVEAIVLNAETNGVSLEATSRNLLEAPAQDCDVILVGDLFYEKDLAAKVVAWLEDAEARGIVTLIGDPGRSYLPREKLKKLAEYKVAVTRDLEDAEFKLTSVWRLSKTDATTSVCPIRQSSS